MKNLIIEHLISLTYGDNNSVKIKAIMALGYYKSTASNLAAILRLIDLSKNTNINVSVTAIDALTQLSFFF